MNKIDIIVDRLGTDPITVSAEGSREVWNETWNSNYLVFTVRIECNGKSYLFDFRDTVLNYINGDREMDDFKLAKLLEEALLSASLGATMSFDDYNREFNMFSRESNERSYEKHKKEYEQLRDVFGVDGFAMKEASREILDRYNWFPAFRGEHVINPRMSW